MIFFIGSINGKCFSKEKLVTYYEEYYERKFDGCCAETERINFVMIDNDNEAEVSFFEEGDIGVYGDLVNAFWNDGEECNISNYEKMALEYKKEGINAIKKLSGDFSFVLVDYLSEKVFMVRDQFGIKQLFWHKKDNNFVFSNLLFGLNDFYDANTVSEEFVKKYFDNNGLLDFCQTPYKEVYRVNVASYVEMGLKTDDTFLKEEKYWGLTSDISKRTIENEEQWILRVDKLIGEAVWKRRKNEMSLLLSGGLDSTTLFSYLSENKEIELEAFSAVFEELDSCDEREYINEMVDKYPEKTFNYVNCDKGGILEGCPYTYFYTSEPHINVINKALNEKLFLAIKDKGYRYVVDGFFADHIFNGSIYYVIDEIKKGHFVRAFRFARSYAESSNRSVWNVFFEEIIPMRNGKMFGIADEVIRENAQSLSRIKKYSNSDLIIQIRSSIARNFADFELAPRYGLECIHPYVDTDLVEALYEIPGQYKCSNGINKEILRKVSKEKLPKKIVDRVVKTNHTELSQKGLRDNWAEIYNILSVGRICKFGVLNISVEEWNEKILLFRSGKEFDDCIWILVSLEIWLYSIEKKYGVVKVSK